ncbi:murein L,D-transpeptidase catalytic domain family protein [Stenotrophomonas sp. SY1]|jgi:hypothetical protein|uniref:murein L,D-transpeptidase catalytic domain family protein n=1 Tax=Stenotrophomonas sp. SY1 TaxID=477235 RepID=UPI001E34A14A|nr:murein L,D-transpeptidase catalytic domain family protein [Stenotrophomonas sp. SY1]MCD9088634.1 murein L,D-transpeptidase catalytic domain family protein [Stenotrophomonas sp. SY1]
MKLRLTWPVLLGLGALSGTNAVTAAPAASLGERLARAAPEANATVLKQAASAMMCASSHDPVAPRRLAVIDYSRPSTQRRLWLFDLNTATLLDAEWVAHGRGSGDNTPTSFSNRPGSYQSSLGLFQTGVTYQGGNGYSLRLEGLEPGINDLAASRAIVIHGADYVSESSIHSLGRLGRSLGCPALRRTVARRLIDELAGGQYVYAYYPDPAWLSSPAANHCATSTAGTPAPAASRSPGKATAAVHRAARAQAGQH